jgi:hypothetical protein
MRTPVWCRRRAAEIGEHTTTVIAELLEVNALFRLRAAQGVLGLATKQGPERLEAACWRAIEVGDPSYRIIKGILAAGTENVGVEQPGRTIVFVRTKLGADRVATQLRDRLELVEGAVLPWVRLPCSAAAITPSRPAASTSTTSAWSSRQIRRRTTRTTCTALVVPRAPVAGCRRQAGPVASAARHDAVGRCLHRAGPGPSG